MRSVVVCLIACAGAAFQNVLEAAEPDQSLDEVVVTGTRLRPHELRKLIVEAEDQFYGRYNELNRKDEFDVNCIVAARTGTNLKQRSCLPVFEERAIQKMGQEAFTIRQDVQEQIRLGAIQKGPATPPVSAAGEINAIRPTFQANMRRVVLKDSALRELLKRRATLEQELKELKSRGIAVEDELDATPGSPEAGTESLPKDREAGGKPR
jgi:hypothetical protein